MSNVVAAVAETARKADSEINPNKRLIVALDVPTVDEAQKIVSDLNDAVTFYKIGLHLQWDDGVKPFIEKLKSDGKDVFIDYKYSDIGETMRGGVAGAARRGIRFLTIQGNGEVTEEGIRAAVEGRGDHELPKIFFVTVLTSLDDMDLHRVGFTKPVHELAVERAKMAQKAGLDGVISSGREAHAIREATSRGFLIITPGIRPAGSDRNDHKRPSSPTDAINNCADYLVVGRPIIKSANRRAAAEKIIEEMRTAFDARA